MYMYIYDLQKLKPVRFDIDPAATITAGMFICIYVDMCSWKHFYLISISQCYQNNEYMYVDMYMDICKYVYMWM
jgi:hypothetical protein